MIYTEKGLDHFKDNSQHPVALQVQEHTPQSLLHQTKTGYLIIQYVDVTTYRKL